MADELSDLYQAWVAKHQQTANLASQYFKWASGRDVEPPERSLTRAAVGELKRARKEENKAWLAYVAAVERQND